MALQPNDFVIDDSTHPDVTHPVGYSRGLVPRDFSTHPVGFYGSIPAMESIDLPLIPRDEWVQRIRDMEAAKSRLSDIRRRSGPGGGLIPSLDQDGIGYCWNHSGTMAVMLARALMGEPYVRLSAFMIGCLVKNYQDEGGWGAQGIDFIAQNGVPSVDFWPEKSMKRSNDTPEMRANAKQHLVVKQWADMQAAQYDRNLTEDQSMTLLLLSIGHVADFNWWSHSIFLMDPVIANESLMSTDFGSLDLTNHKDAEVYTAAFGKRGINSWTDSYGDKGEFVLTGSKMKCDGGVAALVTAASLT